ncbi:hypothetical protein SODALDRAFT_327748 [Sodiomyces alkalinus F11]|uniref:Myb-like DNA-binding domain-containing protein n=1 Tax=Sodiomyces alkalinus (strain CBS 110278 / VKM F-3762 / F11) TaxID=1314773 RepID=A0A3N2Q9Y1_SODAK|nr:hypothetical protein SODALDRAFT_327748 [Sodiomyces alkalinus F11]ROT43546.1 hypothetical protein SODALDRAFT_327748 [Sodiomyces alkalinus F11]
MSNTDNQMTRFLFAILKQKNLKDIDWNAVARDPVLAQPITNGHAARMRYSRFRSAMLGLEPQRRNRNANNKNKVTKPKKEYNKIAKKEEDEYIKSESGINNRPIFSDANARSSVKVKHEASQLSYHQSQFTPTSMGSPAGPDCHPTPHMRLLTPSSDDMLPAPHTLQFSPQTGILGTFDMLATGHCGHEHDHEHDPIHDHASWANSPAYSAFDAAFNIEGYGLGGMCDHHSGGTPSEASGMHVPSAMGLGIPEHVDIKAGQWNSQYHR